MSSPPPNPDLMQYEAMAQDALRGVVKMALKRAASPQGIPGDHHFFISFRTHAPGVSGPPELLAQYPSEMKIVLQHQFWDLAPGETFFAVTLKFGGQPKRLSIPYSAVTEFFDPHAQFLLQFSGPAPQVHNEAPAAQEPDAGVVEAEPPAAAGDEPKVVSLDQFRKK